MELVDSHKSFGGEQRRYLHSSAVLSCDMHFSVYLPPRAQQQSVPVVYWLSGLSCSDENFVNKAGAQQFAAELGLALIAADTSPRGEHVPDDPDQAYDFGLGAGFYLNATQEPWARHYQMYDYIVQELPTLLGASELPVDVGRASISGHSMGGHGALTIALKNPDLYRSVSAFSPIVSPMNCPWGRKAFTGYLGSDQLQWQAYDSCQLMQQAQARLPALVDQGSGDDFLQQQLKTELLEQVAQASDYPVTIRRQAGYDHSYFFVASFIGEHLRFHAQALAA